MAHARPPFGKPGSAWTKRGFTGHEHVEGLDTVHMNGRLYWISGGRFVQPDPVLTDPLNPQNWNPYSYVVNNPLNPVDPTGYSFVDTLIHPLRKVVRGLMRSAGPEVSGVVAGASCGALPYGWGIVCAAGGGYDIARAFGANPSQARRSAVAAAFAAAISWGMNNLGIDPSSARGVLISATAGGVSSVLQGGQFGHGFASAGITSYASPYINNVSSNPVAGATASANLGGTVSEMTGGKFRNGAMTGAFSYSVYSFMIRLNR